MINTRKSEKTENKSSKKFPPAQSVEARENQLISLAIDVAEEQLRNRTASSQVITHYLKLGSTKERIEKEILEKQKELITAKTEALASAKHFEELVEDAMKAFRSYGGGRTEEVDQDVL